MTIENRVDCELVHTLSNQTNEFKLRTPHSRWLTAHTSKDKYTQSSNSKSRKQWSSSIECARMTSHHLKLERSVLDLNKLTSLELLGVDLLDEDPDLDGGLGPFSALSPPSVLAFGDALSS